jgi:F-type H+-transporting ATPase subunit b
MELNFTLVGQIITFFILLYLLNRFLYGPISTALKQRAETIRIGLDAAEKGRRDLEEARQKYQEMLDQAKIEAQDILNKAQKRAEVMKEETVAQAREEAGRVIQKAKEEIQVEWQKARMDLKREVADMVFLATGKIMKSSVDRQKHLGMINEVVEEMSEGRIR